MEKRNILIIKQVVIGGGGGGGGILNTSPSGSPELIPLISGQEKYPFNMISTWPANVSVLWNFWLG